MLFNAKNLLNDKNILDISSRDLSYSPLFSTIGLVSPFDFPGIKSLALNYNRTSRMVWNNFIKFEDGLLRVPTSIDRLCFENDNSRVTLAFYAKDSFVIEAENTESIELCSMLAEDSVSIWAEEASSEQIILRGYSLNTDPRDPDKSAPFRAGIKAINGKISEFGSKITVKADNHGRIYLAFSFEALETSLESIIETLSKSPISMAEGLALSREWFVDMLFGFEASVNSERESRIVAKALKSLLFNATIGQGFLRGYVSAFPSRGKYPTHYLWDSCFQNLALEYLNPKLAKDSMLLYNNCQRSDGKFPHFICSTWFRPHDTQPPLIGWATLRLVKSSSEKDEDFMQKMLSALEKNNEWWLNQRMTRHGVIYCPHGLETGQDDSPRFDDGPILAVDMNSYLLNQMKSTSELAAILGNEASSEKWRREADTLSKNIVKVMYDPEENIFFDADVKTAEHKTLWSASAFLPLWAGVDIKADKAREMIKNHLLDKEKFFGKVPFPCIAYNQKEYRCDKWWRGPLWLSLAWLMVETLEKYGFEKEYNQVSKTYYDMLLNDGNLREHFNSQTAEGLGTYDQGWTSAIFIKLNKLLNG